MTAGGSGIRLMMTTDAVGGVWVFATTLARSLGLASFEVLLVTLGPRPTAAQTAMVRGCRGVSLVETALALEWQAPAGGDVCDPGTRSPGRGSDLEWCGEWPCSVRRQTTIGLERRSAVGQGQESIRRCVGCTVCRVADQDRRVFRVEENHKFHRFDELRVRWRDVARRAAWRNGERLHFRQPRPVRTVRALRTGSRKRRLRFAAV